MGDFYEYLLALAGYGKWLVTGGPYLAENIIKRVKPEWIASLDKKINVRLRKRIEVGIILGAVFVAGFLAWRDEHAARQSASRNPSIRHLREDQKDRIRVGLSLPLSETYNFQINSMPNCDECEQFAEEMREFFNTIPGWHAEGGPLIFVQSRPRRNLWLLANEKVHLAIVDKVEKAFVAGGVPLIRSNEEVQPDAFVILVARPGN
jgi:hypothetical protein